MGIAAAKRKSHRRQCQEGARAKNGLAANRIAAVPKASTTDRQPAMPGRGCGECKSRRENHRTEKGAFGKDSCHQTTADNDLQPGQHRRHKQANCWACQTVRKYGSQKIVRLINLGESAIEQQYTQKNPQRQKDPVHNPSPARETRCCRCDAGARSA